VGRIGRVRRSADLVERHVREAQPAEEHHPVGFGDFHRLVDEGEGEVERADLGGDARDRIGVQSEEPEAAAVGELVPALGLVGANDRSAGTTSRRKVSFVVAASDAATLRKMPIGAPG
jgi:hypothetical protein